MGDKSVKQPVLALKDFLTGSPPGTLCSVRLTGVAAGISVQFKVPVLNLYCTDEACEDFTQFDPNVSERTVHVNPDADIFISYRCRHCRRSQKTYALRITEAESFTLNEIVEARILKYGELPEVNLALTSRISKLIGQDRDFFYKGVKAECSGLGIAAFTYYRRVVENQKDRIFDEIIKVCKRLGVTGDIVAELEKAKKETQFTKAVGLIKSELPDSLKIDNHNPLTLLHDALSDSIHNASDEDCLALAQSIRVVLSKLAENLNFALQQKAELMGAVNLLLNRKNKNSSPEKPANGSTKTD
ncbi:hypothetical protein [Pedosphaera parvula]|uniref:Uncharacterized protein n=1 Tax=Pedosphaera parvula (strain Ellin514) TaxID=320771 RepID=B9XKC4_PEDPL|nr:hypothetical protein [Pedosphaera parvula]EEF59762.1 hypothetical protein Cflav_PD2583 [Pedosphaera parvula Ellin514]